MTTDNTRDHKSGCPMLSNGWAASIPRYCNCNETSASGSGQGFMTTPDFGFEPKYPNGLPERGIEEWRDEFTRYYGALLNKPVCCGMGNNDCGCDGRTYLNEITGFIDELLHQELQKALTVQAIQIREEEANEYNKIIERELQKAREQIYKDLLSKLDGYKVIDGVSFEGSLPPAEIFTEMLEDTNLIRDNVNGVIDFIKKDLQSELDQPITSE